MTLPLKLVVTVISFVVVNWVNLFCCTPPQTMCCLGLLSSSSPGPHNIAMKTPAWYLLSMFLAWSLSLLLTTSTTCRFFCHSRGWVQRHCQYAADSCSSSNTPQLLTVICLAVPMPVAVASWCWFASPCPSPSPPSSQVVLVGTNRTRKKRHC